MDKLTIGSHFNSMPHSDDRILERKPHIRGCISWFGLIVAVGAHALATPLFAQFKGNETLNAERVEYQGTVALIHGEDGESNRLLWLPSGKIVTVPKTQLKATKRPFIPLERAAIVKAIQRDRPGLAGAKVTETAHHVFLSLGASSEFRETAGRILHSMVSGMANHVRAMRVPVHRPPTPLVVILFGNRAAFDAYRKLPPGVQAYYEPVSNCVVVCEQLQADIPQIAYKQHLATIAHEGAHQILHNIGLQKRLSLWPAWLSEGLAEYCAPTTFGKNLTWKGSGEVNDWRMYELERFLKSGAGRGELIGDTVLAERLTSTGYATAWALTHYLAKRRRTEFHALLRHYSQRKPLSGNEDAMQGVVPSQRADFAKRFGTDFLTMESQLVRHLKSLPYQDPFAAFPHFVGFCESRTDAGRRKRQADVFHSSKDAERWCKSQKTAQPEAKTIVRPFPNRRQAETFAENWLRSR